MTPTTPCELTAGLRIQRDEIVIAVEGDDARTWLNGQMTNDLKRLTEGTGVYGLVLTIKGRVLADLFAFERGGALFFSVDRAVWPALHEQLEKYIIMEDVSLRETTLRTISVCGARVGELDLAPLAARGASVVKHARLGPSLEVVVEERELAGAIEAASSAIGALRAGDAEIDDPEWERARISMGVPRFPVDFGDRTYPQEAGLKKRALAFDKGCYLGQEVVCMLENRGQVTRSLVRLAIEAGTAAGTPLRRGEDVVGELTSVAGGHGLGFVKRALTEAGTDLESERGPAKVLGLVD
jgi:folate-binding protein YgfZ